MFIYYLRLAVKSIKRNPVLSGLMVAAIALGIGSSMTTITVNYLMSANPIPEKSHALYYVQVDSWDPHNAFNEDDIPNQLTWTEATNLMAANRALRQAAMSRTGGIMEPDNKDVKPFEVSARLTFRDFFAMFEVPFLYGNPWSARADEKREQVVVLTKRINEQVFGGVNSVGESIRLFGRQFRVVGVLDDWQPMPKFYDVNNGAFEESEEVFIPFMLKEELALPSWGNTNCWKAPEGDGFEAQLRSECIGFQMWVELPTLEDKAAYLDFLHSYVSEQKTLGRFPRPMQNRLSDVMTWMEDQEVVADDAQIMLWLSLMFLFVCLLNTIGLLLAKFSGKASEIGLRRAVGASKGDVFLQHLVETALIGLVGGLLGLSLALVGLEGIKSLYGEYIQALAVLDLTMVLVGLVLALVSSVAAGLYPTWRACNIAPASQLKSQ